MKKKSLKVAHGLMRAILTIILIFALAGTAIAVYNVFNFDPDIARYIYVCLGSFIIPFEYLLTDNLGLFAQKGNVGHALIIAIMLLVVTISILINASRMNNDKLSSKKRTFARIYNCVFIMTFAVIFSLAVYVLLWRQFLLIMRLNSIMPEFVQKIITQTGLEIAFYKEMFIGCLGLGLCLTGGILLIIGMSRGATKVKTVSNILFYSSEYEQKQESKVETTQASKWEQTKQDNTPVNQTTQQQEEIKDKGSSKLIKKIMILDKLRQSGKLSDVEYVRLRQSAIKRYK